MMALNHSLLEEEEHRVRALMSDAYYHWCCAYSHTAEECHFRWANKELRKCEYQHCRNSIPHGKEFCHKLLSHARRVVKGQELSYAVDVLRCVQRFDSDTFDQWDGPDMASLWEAAGKLPSSRTIERY